MKTFTHLTLAMPWGVREYRFAGVALCGWPIEVHGRDSLGWFQCPNVNVHIRIAALIPSLQLRKQSHVV